MKNSIASKKSTPAPMTFKALLGAWTRARNMTPGEFSHLSKNMLDHIGSLIEYRYRLAELGKDDLVSFLSALHRVCELRPVNSNDLLTILLTDPRATFRSVPWEWLTSLRDFCPTTTEELQKVWSDDRLKKHQRAIIGMVLLTRPELIVKFAEGMKGIPDLDKKFKQWLWDVIQCLDAKAA